MFSSIKYKKVVDGDGEEEENKKLMAFVQMGRKREGLTAM